MEIPEITRTLLAAKKSERIDFHWFGKSAWARWSVDCGPILSASDGLG